VLGVVRIAEINVLRRIIVDVTSNGVVVFGTVTIATDLPDHTVCRKFRLDIAVNGHRV